MGIATRKTLQEFWQEQPEDFTEVEITLDNWFDVNDESNPDDLDRAVIVTYDKDTNVSFGGVVALENIEDKPYFGEAWNSRDVKALLKRPAEGSLSVLAKPEEKEGDGTEGDGR